MEVSGVLYRSVPSFSGAGIDAHFHASSSKPYYFPDAMINVGAGFSGKPRLVSCRDSKVFTRPIKFSGFCDSGHMQHYYGSSSMFRCGGGEKKEKEKGSMGMAATKKMKKKLKLLKDLSRDLSMFSEMGFGLNSDRGLVGEVKGKTISEAAELLLGHLQQLKAEEKELKRKKKEERSKLKIERMQNKLDCEVSSSSSSESSDSDCGEVVDMTRLKSESLGQPSLNELQSVIQEPTLAFPSTLAQEGNTIHELQPVIQETTLILPSISNTCQERCLGVCSSLECAESSTSCSNVGSNDGSGLVAGAYAKKIEVCMGGKCKKSGAATLLEEFQRVVGVESAVVGCKCMGKCRDGPNVRVLNSLDGSQVDDSVRTPTNPLCIGVGFEDVNLIVSNFFGETQKDLGLATAS